MQMQMKSKKVTGIPEKYLPEKDDPNAEWSDDPATRRYLLERAFNMEEQEKRAKAEAKQREQELLRMQEFEAQQKEQYKQRQETTKNLSQRQFDDFASGGFYTCSGCFSVLRPADICWNSHCQAPTRINKEPLMGRLKQELSSRIELDEHTRNRLEEFGRKLGFVTADADGGFSFQDIINKLMY
jgi:hypothetical protein